MVETKENWRDYLDDRQKKEVALAEHYASDPHGTDGHNRLLLIAKLAQLLDEAVYVKPEDAE